MDLSTMKKWLVFLALLTVSCSPKKLAKDPVSYHKGYTIWKRLAKDGEFPYDASELIQGIKDASLKKSLDIDEKEVVDLLDQFNQKQAVKNIAQAEEFLKALPEERIEVIPSKLYYLQIQSGKGVPLLLNSEALITYSVAVLENGVFNEIFSTGPSPISLCPEDTIPGFYKGVEGMLQGEKRAIYIHPDLTQGNYDELAGKLIRVNVERQSQ